MKKKLFELRCFPFVTACLCLLLFISCSSLRYVEIETYNPSVITLPKAVRNVLILNNAVTQQAVSYEPALANRKESAIKANADSTASDFCRVLGERIVDAPRFDDVRLYKGSFRTDHSFVSEQRLTDEQVRELCKREGVDAVISLDRLLFKMKGFLVPFADTPLESVKVEVLGTVRIAVPDVSLSVNTVLLSDTIDTDLSWDSGEGETVLKGLDLDLLLRDVSVYLADKTSMNFVPYWETDSRWYYTASGAAWKEATAYAAADNWSKAASIWQRLYDDASGWKTKARLAANLALCEEINGSLGKALEWAKQSYGLYREHSGEAAWETRNQKVYVSVLEHRIHADKRLRKQL